AALQKHGLDAAQAAHIGDSESKDIRGAGNIGLKAILVDRSREPESHSLCRVRNLDEIFPLLFG
ncbi:MAG: HAD family hydrolase, partial [Alphaproteobacteria bacterium]